MPPREACKFPMSWALNDKQLRHRIYKAILGEMLIAIDEKAKELGAPIIYNNGSRIGRCSKGGEKWYRDVASTM